MPDTTASRLDHRVSALIVGTYITSVIVFGLARIEFRLLAVVQGSATVFTASKTRTFILFTGPARGIALTLLLLPVLARGSKVSAPFMIRIVVASLVSLAVVYAALQWNHELAQANRILGLLLLVSLVTAYGFAISRLVPRCLSIIGRIPRRVEVPLAIVLLIVAIALAVVGAVTIVFNDLQP